nr:MAG TPA: hypothetical protein [Caudoviricetes sp.]
MAKSQLNTADHKKTVIRKAKVPCQSYPQSVRNSYAPTWIISGNSRHTSKSCPRPNE